MRQEASIWYYVYVRLGDAGGCRRGGLLARGLAELAEM
jgi:hypothetical protein